MNEIIQTTEVPQDFEAEQALLGAILKRPRILDEISDFLRPQAFFGKAHRFIYEVMLELTAKNGDSTVDEILVANRLKEKKQFEDAGGYLYLVELPDFFPISADPIYYARIIHEKYLGREVIRISGDLTRRGRDPSSNVGDLLQEAESKLSEIALKSRTDRYSHIYEVSRELLVQLDKKSKSPDEYIGIRSGFSDLDKITSGWQNSDLVIIAARPSMGKTAFALNIASHAAMNLNKSVLIFSLEMQKEQIAQRILSSEAKLTSEMLKNPANLSADDWENLGATINRFEKKPIYINDTPGIQIRELTAITKRLNHQLKQEGRAKLSMLIVDYLQLMRGSSARTQNREQEIAEISRSLKGLAKELNIPVLALAQLNRDLESRTDKRPNLSDLRESGALEQDADIILFIYRDEVYDSETKDKNIAEILIKKHRNGSTGKVKLGFVGSYTKFGSFSAQMSPPNIRN